MDIEETFFNTSDFEIQGKKLGEGTFGTVYVAKNIKEDKLYACKIIKTYGNFNGHDQMLLMRESLILNKLRHPGIVEFKGVNFQSFEDPNKLEPSIITEYLRGGSLKAVLDQEKKSLANSKWSPTKKYILLLGIANAMKYLHNHGIIHRDLKPENILVDEEMHPRICDFGLSRCFKKSLTNSTKLAMIGQIGTLMYMAPELLAGEEHYSSSVDVYSFSMIAYELVTGKVPFSELDDNITAVALGIKVANGYRPEFPSFVPLKMQQLISRCWSGDSLKRPSFEEIFNELSNDFTYLGETVDNEEVEDFISMLEEIKVGKSADFDEKNIQTQIELSDLKKKLPCYTASNEIFIESLHNLYGDTKERNLIEGINKLKISSEKGNSYSSFLLGLMYKNGNGVESDFDKAKFYFEQSTSQGNSGGVYAIGWSYYNGYGVKQDYSKAHEYYEKAAELGNSYAYNNLGVLYKNGQGVKQDYSKAHEYYEKAAELGNTYGYNNLGYLYQNGYGVKQDYSKTLEYYEKAAELGNSYGYNNLGYLYQNGYGVKQDYSKAREYYEKAAKLGNSTGYINIGNLYYGGFGVKQDYSKTLEYYEKAAELGNSLAYNNLGYLYQNGLGVKKNYSKALEYYEKAAELGNSYAYNNLGNLYYNGQGVKKNYSKALEYYEKAAELGNTDVYNILGVLYENGQGVKKHYSKAREYYEKAAELGNSSAYNNLGYLYQYGIGVKQDYSKAVECYQMAIEFGDKDAPKYLSKLQSRMRK